MKNAENQKTILLVDDEAVIAMSEKMALEKYGYNVITTLSGEEAVATVETTPGIDLILMDINLGAGMDGTDAAAIILRQRDLPVVFLSSHTEPEVVEKTEKITSYGYVVKDSSITVLDASIKMAFKLFETKTREKEKESQMEAALAALRESEARYRAFFNTSRDCAYITSVAGRWLFMNESAVELFGYSSREELNQVNIPDLYVHPQERVKCIETTMKNKYNKEFPVDLRRKDGAVIHALITEVPRYDGDGKLIGFQGTIRNISERKQVETQRAADLKALREREERQQLILATLPIAIFTSPLDPEIDASWASGDIEKVTGFTVEQYMAEKDFWRNRIHADDRERVLAAYRNPAASDEIILEYRWLCKDGNYKWFYDRAIKKRTRQGIQYFVIILDISERKEAEEAFLREKAFLDQLVESAPEAIVFGKNDGCILRINSEFCRLFGYKEKEVLGKNIDDLIASAEKKSEALSVTQTVGKGEKFSLETVRQRKNGKPINVSLIGSPIIIDGQQVATYGIYRDISDRKRAESQREAALEALHESEERYRALVENASDLIYKTDKAGIFTFVNQAAVLISGYEERELIGKQYTIVIHPDMRDQAIKLFGRQFVRRIQNTYFEYLLLTKDGREVWLGQNTQLIIKDGQVTGFQAVARDISERKQAEEEIKRQLAEKEILLKEVHHRIKNNIASIGGLISLRMQSVTHPQAIAVLQDASGRVDSMRILYDKLLLTEGYADLSVKNYVESLTDSIVALFPDKAKVKLDRQIADFHLDAKQLFPLGIIINELLTNIMKYAFINRKTGLIKISLTKADNHVTLAIQDNGSGLPAGFAINKAKGFGLTLVKMLSQQLGGSFSMGNHKGTRCKIEFDI